MVFGLLLSAGAVVSAVQAGEMALDQALSGCVDSAGASCCDDSGGDAAEDAYGAACLPICAGGASGVMPSRTMVNTADRPPVLAPVYPASLGRAFSPDPDPPRTIDLV